MAISLKSVNAAESAFRVSEGYLRLLLRMVEDGEREFSDSDVANWQSEINVVAHQCREAIDDLPRRLFAPHDEPVSFNDVVCPTYCECIVTACFQVSVILNNWKMEHLSSTLPDSAFRSAIRSTIGPHGKLSWCFRASEIELRNFRLVLSRRIKRRPGQERPSSPASEFANDPNETGKLVHNSSSSDQSPPGEPLNADSLSWNGRSIDAGRGTIRLLGYMFARPAAASVDVYAHVRNDSRVSVPTDDAVYSMLQRANIALKDIGVRETLHKEGDAIAWSNHSPPHS